MVLMWYLKSQRNHSYDAYMAFATNGAGYHIIITTHLKWAWPIFPSPSGWSIGSCFPIHSVSGRRATQMRTAADRTTSAICLHVCALTVGMVEGAMKAESVVNDTPSVSNLRVTTSASVPRTSSGHSQRVPLFIIHKSVEIFHFCVYSMYNKHYQYQTILFLLERRGLLLWLAPTFQVCNYMALSPVNPGIVHRFSPRTRIIQVKPVFEMVKQYIHDLVADHRFIWDFQKVGGYAKPEKGKTTHANETNTDYFIFGNVTAFKVYFKHQHEQGRLHNANHEVSSSHRPLCFEYATRYTQLQIAKC